MNSCRTKFFAKAAMGMLVAMLLSQQVLAGGFSIYEQGGRATAQGGAVVARPWDASAAFYNPAGLAFYGTPGQWRVYAGITPVQSLSKFSGLDEFPGAGVKEKAKDKWFPPFYAYGIYQINDKMAAGLSITTPFGLGTEWENKNNTYSGRFRSILADIQAVYISPTFSYKINDMFGVGVGIDYVFSKVALERHSGAMFNNGNENRLYDVISVELEGEDKGSFGFHLAGYAKVNEKLSFGVDYKHSVNNEYKGTARFRQINTGISALDANVASTLANPLYGGLKQNGNTSVEFPSSLVVGVAYKPIEKLSIELDYVYAGWSVFETVEIEFPESGILPTSILEENYKNTWQIRFGAEYAVNEKLYARLGYIYDKTPAPTETLNPLLPDADRNDIGIGFGYKINDAWHIDAAYLAVMFKERSTKSTNVDGYDGVYNSHVNLFSLGFGYNFGAK
ncbi:outer membrane protein transport protein [bacterium]|nr:outer membrane protein transport protein [bacterium]